jgi:serine/threonine protein kinase
MIGKRIGQYEILEMLGKGGMATVYRAFHPSMERYVAVKIIHQALAQDQAGKDRFRQEARLITRLEHPHLLPVYDYSPDNDPPYIVMRYLEGGTLKDVLEVKKILPLNEVAYLMRQIASALDYAHRLGVIHRDIKPSNIMVDADGNGYLADFGIARISGEAGMTQTGFAVGTPGYMSPEQGMGVANISSATDVYALGVMAFEMLTGQSPYKGDTPMAVLMKHIQSPVPSAVAFNKELPEAVDEVFEKAMAKEPSNRYQTAGELAAELSTLVSKGDINRSPENIRTVAVKAIQEIKENRDESALNKLIKDFEGTRSEGMKAVTLPDTPTTMEKAVPPPANRMPFIVGAVAALVILGLAAFFLFNAGAANQAATSTAEAVAAQDTLTVRAALAFATTDVGPNTPSDEATTGLSPTDTLRPTNTLVPTATASPTETSTATLSPTPDVPILRTSRQLDARTGPADDYAVILTLGANEELEITGRSEDGRWYQVILPTGSLGWIPSAVTFVQVFGPREAIGSVAAPARTSTATPTPNETATAISQLSTANAQATHARSTENAFSTQTQSANNAQGTEAANATSNAISTSNAQATEVALATATSNAFGTQQGLATVNAQSTANARATVDALLMATSLASTQSASIVMTENANRPTPTTAVIEVVADSPGRMPFVMNFEQGAEALAGSDFAPEAWQVVNEGGQSVLVANARITDPFVILGSPTEGVPQWVEATSTDFVVSFRINMTATEGARIVYRYEQGRGYNVLEVTPGRLYLRRSRDANANPLTNRDNEIFLGSGRGYSVAIGAEEWHHIRIWVEGARTFVYLDNLLIATVEDLTQPQLGGGQILLQTQNAFRPVRFDDIIIQRAEAGSDHFQGSSFPSTWQRSDSVQVNIGREADGNQFIEMGRNASANPVMPPTRDLEVSCRIYSVEGGYTLFLRETEAGGALRLSNEAGEMMVEIVDATGAALFSRRVPNFYTRGLWQNLHIFYVDQRLEISLDGDLVFEETLDVQLTGGLVRFATDNNDIVRFDDCLITQSASSGDEGSAFAFELLQDVNGRNFRELRSDLTEDFSDEFRTDVWWLDGLNAPGDYIVDSGGQHQNFLRMSYGSVPTFRLFRDNVGVEIFGLGQDRRSYHDSTDILVTVDLRLPLDTFGEAWLGVRTSPTITGNNINGYFMTLRRNRDNSLSLLVDYRSATGVQSYFEGELPIDGEAPEWINFTVVTLDDQIAFFANGRFIVAVEDAEQLGGTLALGVNQNTTADFDSLIIRDTSPHDQ